MMCKSDMGSNTVQHHCVKVRWTDHLY